MRFRTGHKVVTYLVAGLGILAISVGGVLHPAVLIMAALAAIASWWVEEPLISRPRYNQLWTAALIVILIIQILRIILIGDFVVRSIEFALLLQINRLWNRRGAREYQHVVVLSLVHLIASSVLDQNMSFGILYAGFVIALPWSMTLSHLRREIEGNYRRSEPETQRAHVNRILNSRRIISTKFLWGTALLALPIFVMSGTLFVFFPRIGLGFLAGGPRERITVAGFSDSVELGDLGVVRNDETVVMRVELEPPPDPPPRRLDIHWRGTAYDSYDGKRWSRSLELDHREPIDRIRHRYCLGKLCRAGAGRKTYKVFLEDLDPPILLLPPAPVAVLMGPQHRGGYPTLQSSGLLEVRREANPALVIHYRVESLGESEAFFPVDNLPHPEGRLERYLQLPELDPRISALTKQVVGSARGDPLRSAEMVASHLRSSYEYSLDLRGTSNESPLEDFLLRRRSGHCEFFSTAMAIMLRTVGVPTRNVTGFLGGRLNPYGGDGAYYVLTQSDAHSWVEVYSPSVGWVAFDPTPPGSGFYNQPRTIITILNELIDATQLAWEKNIIAYDLQNQVDFITSAYFASRRFRWHWTHRDIQPPDAASPSARYDLRWWVLGAAALTAIIFVLGWLFLRRKTKLDGRGKRRRSVKQANAEDLIRRLDRILARQGFARPPWRTPLEHALILEDQRHPASSQINEIVTRYNQARFGERLFDDEELKELKGTLRQVVKMGSGRSSRTPARQA